MGNWSYTLLDESLREVQLTDKFVELQSASTDQKKGVEVSTYWVQYSDFVTCVQIGMHSVTGTTDATSYRGISSRHQNFW